MNYARFLTAVSLRRITGPIRIYHDILARSPPSMISLAPGAPNPGVFPFESAEFKLRDGTKVVMDEAKMRVALQYGPTQGSPNLLAHLKKLTAYSHSPPTFDRDPEKGGLDFCVTIGSQDGNARAFEMLTNPGDNVIVEKPTYTGPMSVLGPLGANLLAVETDRDGMIPDLLRAALSPWKPADAQDPQSKIPRVLYTVPYGGNPSGSTLTEERKREIYKIAREYNLLIMEDDPYYYLYFGGSPRIPSFLSMDEDGRVLRFDSFSKIISAGLRIGFVSGPQPLVDRIKKHMSASVMHAPSLTQYMVSELFDRWGIEGFENQVKIVVDFYRSQKDAMIKSANKWLTGLAEWHEPSAGMFLWLRIKGIKDTRKMIMEKAIEKEVLLVPGSVFMTDASEPCPYVRASFSLASYEDMDKGFERLASLIKEEQKEQSK